MPELQEEAGPLLGQNFTDAVWRAIFGAEPAIVGDTDGTAYSATLPPSSDTAEFGSASIESRSTVGGFGHAIPAGTTQSLEIPPSSDATTGRTDLVVVRLDPDNFTTVPGPARLHRIPGVEGSSAWPAFDGGPPGVEDMPLYAITRRSGQALNQATVVDLRARTGPNLVIPAGQSLPTNVPLGTRARRGVQDFSRELVSSTPTWVNVQANLGKYQSYTPTFNTAVTLIEARWRAIGDDIRGTVIGRISSMPTEFTCSLPVTGRSAIGGINPIGTATARSGNWSGANTREGFVIPQGDGALTTVTVVAADGSGNRWGPNFPISWNDHPDGGWFGISFQYERAS